MDESAPLVALRGISLAFGGTNALADVDFELRAGEIHALAGENGAGKSTLMKVLAGIHRPDAGQILLRGAPCRFDGVADASAHGIAIIHQELNLADGLDATANVYLGRELRTRFGLPDRRAMRRRAGAVLDSLGLRASPTQPVGSLRMGERQLVEIAKALVANAQVLAMDEPTSALSPAETERLFALCRTLRARGLGIVLITHRLDEVFALADRITVLRDGRRVGSWPTAEIDSPATLVSLMIGRKFDGTASWSREERAATAAAPLLSVRELRVRHATRVRVRASFELCPGEVLGLSGLLGAGKTELLEALYGSSPHVCDGEIVYDGIARRTGDPARAVRDGIAMVTEDRKRDGLLAERDLETNFMLPNLRRLRSYPWYRPGRAAARVAAWCWRFNVRHRDIRRAAGTLSGGNQQKLILGKWLLAQPRLLLLDEPTRGIDTAAKSEIYRLIHHAASEGTAVLIASADIDELMLLCDRIVVLSAGRISGTLDRAQFDAQRLIQLAAA